MMPSLGTEIMNLSLLPQLPFLLFEASQPCHERSTRVLLLSSLYHDTEAKVINEGHEGTVSSFPWSLALNDSFPRLNNYLNLNQSRLRPRGPMP